MSDAQWQLARVVVSLTLSTGEYLAMGTTVRYQPHTSRTVCLDVPGEPFYLIPVEWVEPLEAPPTAWERLSQGGLEL